MKPFNSFSVLLTEDCNLACKYCYEVVSSGHKNRMMTPDVALKSVEYMFKQENKKVNISFFGGEPTLMPDIIDLMCTKGKELSSKYNKPFSVGIITNATIMNKKLYDIIKKHLDIWDSCQLSVDGPKEIQDQNRVTKSGKGTFDTIEKNLPYWKALFGERLNIHGVLNKSSIPHLFESYKYFREIWNEPMLWFLPAKSANYTDEDVETYRRELGKIYNYIMDIVRRDNSVQEIKNYAPLDRSLRGGSMSKPCGAGEGYCTITSTGDIWPCHHFYYIDVKQELKMGDIWNGVEPGRKKIWDEYDLGDLIGCDGCDHGHCYRCPAENYEANQNPFSQIRDFHCKFMKVDLYYQNLIRKDIEEMGLSDESGCGVDCVGKEDGCQKVCRRKDIEEKSFNDVLESKFDCTEEGVPYKGCGGGSCCGPSKPSEFDINGFMSDIRNLFNKYYKP